MKVKQWIRNNKKTALTISMVLWLVGVGSVTFTIVENKISVREASKAEGTNLTEDMMNIWEKMDTN